MEKLAPRFELVRREVGLAVMYAYAALAHCKGRQRPKFKNEDALSCFANEFWYTQYKQNSDFNFPHIEDESANSVVSDILRTITGLLVSTNSIQMQAKLSRTTKKRPSTTIKPETEVIDLLSEDDVTVVKKEKEMVELDAHNKITEAVTSTRKRKIATASAPKLQQPKMS